VGTWKAKGSILGVALDLNQGKMLVSVDGAAWTVAFPNATHTAPCRPSGTAGAALFPAICGSGGVRVRCNWGTDSGRPMRHSPPSGEYSAVGLLLEVSLPLPESQPLSPTPQTLNTLCVLTLDCIPGVPVHPLSVHKSCE
jgi:hypothetical protein